VFDVPADARGGCRQAAASWILPDGDAAQAPSLAAGPLAPGAIRFRQLELNAQIVRFPSGQEPEFGGQAVYLMRIFGINADDAVEIGLENTPDEDLIASDAALRAELAAYISGHGSDIDTGVYAIPEKFLARKVISFSTF